MDSQSMLLLIIGLGIVIMCLSSSDMSLDSSDSSTVLIFGLVVGGVLLCMNQSQYQPFSNMISNAETYHCIPKSQNFVGTNKVGMELSDVGDCSDPETTITPLKTAQPQSNVLDVSMTKDNVPQSK